MSYSPWGHKELDLTEHICTLAYLLGSVLWEILERGVSFSSVVLKLGCEQQTHTMDITNSTSTWAFKPPDFFFRLTGWVSFALTLLDKIRLWNLHFDRAALGWAALQGSLSLRGRGRIGRGITGSSSNRRFLIGWLLDCQGRPAGFSLKSKQPPQSRELGRLFVSLDPRGPLTLFVFLFQFQCSGRRKHTSRIWQHQRINKRAPDIVD